MAAVAADLEFRGRVVAAGAGVADVAGRATWLNDSAVRIAAPGWHVDVRLVDADFLDALATTWAEGPHGDAPQSALPGGRVLSTGLVGPLVAHVSHLDATLVVCTAEAAIATRLRPLVDRECRHTRLAVALPPAWFTDRVRAARARAAPLDRMLHLPPMEPLARSAERFGARDFPAYINWLTWRAAPRTSAREPPEIAREQDAARHVQLVLLRRV